MENRKTLALLGSTGSIGKNVIEVIKQFRHLYHVKVLVAGSNVHLLAEQALLLGVESVVIGDESLHTVLCDLLRDSSINVYSGRQAVLNAVSVHYDIVFMAMCGTAALAPLMMAIENSNTVATANKETIVSAGQYVMAHAERYGTTLFPVDSEHNAILQILKFGGLDDISSVMLTASGGPFWGYTYERMRDVTPSQAVKHQNWDMGAKISVDSATMMNKGLEVIEAMHLFQMPLSKIKVIVHPQSLVHGIVHYVDGTSMICAAPHDMRIPIAYSLSCPVRLPVVDCIDLAKVSSLDFMETDHKRFPMLRFAMDVAECGCDGAIIAMNVANEVAVERFLQGEIGFLDIYNVVRGVTKHFAHVKTTSIDDVYSIESDVRKFMFGKNN